MSETLSTIKEYQHILIYIFIFSVLINDSEILIRILGFKTFCWVHSEFIKKKF